MNPRNIVGRLSTVTVVVAFSIGCQAGGSATPSGEPSPTAIASTAAPSEAPASVEPSSSGDGSLPVGLHVIDLDPLSTYVLAEDSVTVTIPEPGWFAEPEEGSVTKDLGDFGRVTVAVLPLDIYRVPRNICNWQITPGVDAGPIAESVDELVAYLSEQTWDTPEGSLRREFSPPVDVTIDGYSGQFILDDAPAYPGSDPAGCDEQRYCTLLDRDGGGCYLSHQEPGALDGLWIVDRGEDASFRIVAASGWPNVEFRPEMNRLVDSMTFSTD